MYVYANIVGIVQVHNSDRILIWVGKLEELKVLKWFIADLVVFSFGR